MPDPSQDHLEFHESVEGGSNAILELATDAVEGLLEVEHPVHVSDAVFRLLDVVDHPTRCVGSTVTVVFESPIPDDARKLAQQLQQVLWGGGLLLGLVVSDGLLVLPGLGRRRVVDAVVERLLDLLRRVGDLDLLRRVGVLRADPALREAVEPDPRATGIPSTKGTLSA